MRPLLIYTTVVLPTHNQVKDHTSIPRIVYSVNLKKFISHIPAGIEIIDLIKGKNRQAKTDRQKSTTPDY